MVVPNGQRLQGKTLLSVACCLVVFACLVDDVLAQTGSPLPGARYSAPVPGGTTPAWPGGNQPARGGSVYDKLPLDAGQAIARLEELRNLMPPTTRPGEYQQAINEYCEWLSDMADAHWRLYQAFNKSESTRTQAESERQLNQRFSSLKRQAILLKAEFLIGQKRYPEALAPLVDIAAAEPRSQTGERAYKLLQEIGFSEQLPSTTNAGTSAGASRFSNSLPVARTATPH